MHVHDRNNKRMSPTEFVVGGDVTELDTSPCTAARVLFNALLSHQPSHFEDAMFLSSFFKVHRHHIADVYGNPDESGLCLPVVT